jgi:hypothetical protein
VKDVKDAKEAQIPYGSRKAIKMAIPAIKPAIIMGAHEMLGHYGHNMTNRLKGQVSSWLS